MAKSCTHAYKFKWIKSNRCKDSKTSYIGKQLVYEWPAKGVHKSSPFLDETKKSSPFRLKRIMALRKWSDLGWNPKIWSEIKGVSEWIYYLFQMLSILGWDPLKTMLSIFGWNPLETTVVRWDPLEMMLSIMKWTFIFFIIKLAFLLLY